MRQLPRSLRFYIAASTFYAATIFLAVQYIYTLQLAESGLLVARRDTGDVLASIQLVSPKSACTAAWVNAFTLYGWRTLFNSVVHSGAATA